MQCGFDCVSVYRICYVSVLMNQDSFIPVVCIDLLDESGALMNLSERENSPDFASSFLKERHRYILLKVISESKI